MYVLHSKDNGFYNGYKESETSGWLLPALNWTGRDEALICYEGADFSIRNVILANTYKLAEKEKVRNEKLIKEYTDEDVVLDIIPLSDLFLSFWNFLRNGEL